MRQLKKAVNDFALFGGLPIREDILPVGQLYFPSWERYETAMKGIFTRQYYTNHGPLVQELEERLSDFLGVKHAICVTNATIALMMAVKAMSLTGKIVVPSFTFAASAQSITWAGLTPVFCDVDLHSHQITPETIEPVLDKDVSAILAVNLWGGSCNPSKIESFAAEHNLHLYFDSAHAFGCVTDNTPIGRFGSMEIFSFHATKVLSAAEGGCITTNDDRLAARLRNMRSSHGAGKPIEVPLTSSGRMSEAQAAIALMSLEDFTANVAKNKKLFDKYQELVNVIPGLHIVEPSNVQLSNYQYLVCEVDEEEFGMTRDQLLMLLKAENINARRYFYPGTHRMHPYNTLYSKQTVLPNTDRLCQTLIQFPIGAMVTEEIVSCIGELLSVAHVHAKHMEWDLVRELQSSIM